MYYNIFLLIKKDLIDKKEFNYLNQNQLLYKNNFDDDIFTLIF